MRELKFRAWDDGEGLMLYSDGTPGGTGDRVTDMIEFWWVSERRAAYIMQYTGLKDKNGTEIYEGDVLRVEDYSNHTVFWSEFKGSFVVDLGDNGVQTIGDTWHVSLREVIGNIYENPELVP